ncbi:MAG: hypothetical protein EOS72_28730 [Mesorhizobium sp.]|uniref:DUF6161 domain-containing protein n=1 Tax=Mesorhizobium sp. TaxID=1871066 RepID=UPI000FE5EEA4|nr:DUF6161 domain-containing protein [Mesorhizobium sp.]RWC84946.1 MAG: hypothetical protein EOS72_28730 [Mesorhizobium sp.]
MDDLIYFLIELLRDRSVELDDKTGGNARALVAQQTVLYDELRSLFQDVPFQIGSTSGSAGISDLADAVLRECRELMDSNPATFVQSEGKSIVSGRLPILRDDDMQQLRSFVKVALARRSPEQAKQFGIIAAAALIVESNDSTKSPIINSQELSGRDGLPMIVQIAVYNAHKTERAKEPERTAAVSNEIAALTASLQNYRAEFEKERADQRVQLDVLSAAGVGIDEKSQQAIAALSGFQSDLLNHENAIREEWKLDRARLNWNTRYLEARRGFQVSCVILFVFLIVTTAVAYFFGPAIVASVNHFDVALFVSGGSVGTAIAHQFSRLVVFSVPILVYLWMLKAVMRYFVRSMLLMDDARQRETMLDTYFLLTEKGRADERDRPLILWALFRQTPGHGPDGIEPPDFTEVINAGFNRAKLQG